MTRKETIQAQARDHAKRGIFDNSICRNWLEKVIYSESWVK